MVDKRDVADMLIDELIQFKKILIFLTSRKT